VLERDGIEGLVALPTIGHSIANLVDSYLRHGHMPLLDRLRGEANAEHFFSTLPGVGPELSHRIYDHLHVETLPELFAAAQQGRLEQVPGLGNKRIRAIRESLSQRLGQKSVGAKRFETDRSVPVEELLAIDEEYRKKGDSGELIKIAPSRFNPGNVAWLPILHTERNGRHYTALFSNTARAHELNTTRDWVVVYRDDAHSHGRWTIITSQFGKLHGCRIVRGREDECESFYHEQSKPRPTDAVPPPDATPPNNPIGNSRV
jgi:putative hydrolase